MRFLGLSPTALLLTLLGSALLLIALHFLRPPTPRTKVASLALWRKLAGETKPPRALPRRLGRSLSLLLGLSLLAALTAALAEPERVGRARRVRVIVIDRSGSMAARDLAPSRLAHATATARDLLHELEGGDRAALVSFASDAHVHTALSDDRQRLTRALEQVTQSDGRGELERGLRVALSLAPPPGSELVLLSDETAEQVERTWRKLGRAQSLRLRHVRLAAEARNVAITSLAARAYPLDPGHHETLVTLHNYGAQEEPLTLQLSAASVPLREQSATLLPHTSRSFSFPELAPAGSLLEARIALAHGPDLLASDDRSSTPLPRSTPTRVLLVSRGNRFLEAALLLDETLLVDERTPEQPWAASDYDLLVLDGVLPKEAPSKPTLYLAPPASEGYFPRARGELLVRPFFDRILSEHPLVRELALRDVNVAEARRITPAPDDVVIASSEQGAPLLLEGEAGELPFVAVTFAVAASDLVLRPAFPLLVLRALARLGRAEESVSRAHDAGEPFSLALPRERSRVTLIDPQGARTELTAVRGVLPLTLERAGDYWLEAAGTRIPLAVKLPSSESELGPAPTRAAPTRHARSQASGESSAPLWRWFVLLAVLLSLLEWLAYHRRWSA